MTIASAARRGRFAGLGRRAPQISLLLGLLALGLVTLLATMTLSSFNVFVYDSCLLACIGAIGLNMLMGTAGLVSIGNAAFMAAGGFTTVYFVRAHVPFPVDVLLAGVAAAVFGLIVGLPAVRLKGLTLALATLAAVFIVNYLGNEYQSHVPGAGTAGFTFKPLFFTYGIEREQQYWAWLLYGVVVLALLAAWALVRGKTGRAWRLLREHESVAATVGIPVTLYKLEVFTISGFMIGVEGALGAHFSGAVSTDSFTLLVSISYVAMILIGGLDSLVGSVIGAFLITALPTLVPKFTAYIIGQESAAQKGPQIALIVYGALIILFISRSPRGIAGWFKTLGIRFLSRNAAQDQIDDSDQGPAEPNTTVIEQPVTVT